VWDLVRYTESKSASSFQFAVAPLFEAQTVSVPSPPVRAPGKRFPFRRVSPGASTTSLFERHPITARTGMGDSIDMDRADLSRRAGVTATAFRLRVESARSQSAWRPTPSALPEDGASHSAVLETCRDTLARSARRTPASLDAVDGPGRIEQRAVPVSVPTSERAASVRSRKAGRSDGSTSTSCRVIRAAGISDGVAYAM